MELMQTNLFSKGRLYSLYDDQHAILKKRKRAKTV